MTARRAAREKLSSEVTDMSVDARQRLSAFNTAGSDPTSTICVRPLESRALLLNNHVHK